MQQDKITRTPYIPKFDNILEYFYKSNLEYFYKSNFEELKELAKQVNISEIINQKDSFGRTALLHFVCQGNTKMVEWLIDHGASLFINTNLDKGPHRSLLEVLFWRLGSPSMEHFEKTAILLVAKGVPFNPRFVVERGKRVLNFLIDVRAIDLFQAILARDHHLLLGDEKKKLLRYINEKIKCIDKYSEGLTGFNRFLDSNLLEEEKQKQIIYYRMKNIIIYESLRNELISKKEREKELLKHICILEHALLYVEQYPEDADIFLKDDAFKAHYASLIQTPKNLEKYFANLSFSAIWDNEKFFTQLIIGIGLKGKMLSFIGSFFFTEFEENALKEFINSLCDLEDKTDQLNFNLASIYLHGLFSVEKNIKKAILLFKKVQVNSPELYILARMEIANYYLRNFGAFLKWEVDRDKTQEKTDEEKIKEGKIKEKIAYVKKCLDRIKSCAKDYSGNDPFVKDNIEAAKRLNRLLSETITKKIETGQYNDFDFEEKFHEKITITPHL